MNPSRLFQASCIALIATAMSFAIRGDIMGDFEREFALTATDVGWISGAAFWGFGLSILFGGPLVDALGMATLARLAAAGHLLGTVLTIFALVPLLAGAIPGGMSYIPTAMVTWPAAALDGQAVPLVTPVIWFILTAGLAVLAIRRMGRIEL